jgi:hypothetical protein
MAGESHSRISELRFARIYERYGKSLGCRDRVLSTSPLLSTPRSY